MSLGVRGFNPIWLLDDLEANLFDDNFYMYVLENVLPYIPSTVYHDPDLMLPWTNPIQFLANGTLPIDIFWDPDKVYRLEFRQNLGILPPSQSDPLIYEVNDYMPGTGGSTPIDTIATASSNQITNPQFSLISFASPLTLTSLAGPDPIEIAPGWFLELGGTGNATIERIALNSAIPTPSNAPYAIRLNLSGWNVDEVFLRQRFQQNGVLWANKTVSSAVTARLQGAPQSISATLVDSNGNTLTEVLASTPVTEEWTELRGYGELDASTNPNTPPAAYIDYKLALPNNIDIYLTSLQLVVQDLPFTPSFEQDSIDRQLDHTFHYYKDSLLRQQKQSVLTGWDFALNPWQFYPVATTNFAGFGYTADQTIVIQQAYVASATGNNISTARGTATQDYGFLVTAVTAANQFALIQYIDPATIRGGWGKIFSSLVKLNAQFQNGSLTYRMKMKLIWRTSLPSTISQVEPIATWAASGEPVFSAGWTAGSAINDPIYLVVNGDNTLTFEGFELPAAAGSDMTLGIVLYSMNSMTQTGTADRILFDRISLVENDFAIDAPALTYNETLERCQYYYETSFAPAGAALTSGPQRNDIANSIYEPQNAFFSAASVACVANGFGHQYQSIKRANPLLNIYSGSSTTAGRIDVFVDGNTQGSVEVVLATYFTAFGTAGVQAFAYRGTTTTAMVGPVASATAGSAGMLYHYIADARLGI